MRAPVGCPAHRTAAAFAALVLLLPAVAAAEAARLVRIALAPVEARRGVGESQFFTAIGHFTDGSERNLTQRVVYRSSAPAVAAAPNERGKRSRIDALAPGSATISATDPASGISSTDSGGDATLVIVGQIVRLTVAPPSATRAVGEIQYFTALGHSADGATRNLTQRVDYTSSDPAIAIARNVPGERSRVETVAPGTVTISARDPASGISSDDSDASATLTVLGALERITLAPVSPRKPVGAPQRFTATGHYGGGTTKNLTQRLEYATTDATVARATNRAGDKSLIETVAPGTVTISARDPQTGIQSADGDGDATLVVFDPAAPARPAARLVCGDADGSGALGAADVLWLAAAALGLREGCAPAVCDTDGDGAVGLGDARALFWRVAGYETALRCPGGRPD